MNRIFGYAAALFAIALVFGSCSMHPDSLSIVSIDNGSLCLGFDAETGHLVSLRDGGEEYIDSTAVTTLPWVLHQMSGASKALQLPTALNIKRLSKRQLQLHWTQADGAQGLEVKVLVELERKRSLSYWSIEVLNAEGLALSEIHFPYITGIKPLEDEKLAASTWLGSLYNKPRIEGQDFTYTFHHPGHLSMQLLALYDPAQGGLYLSSNDTNSYSKDYRITFHQNHTSYYISHPLPLNHQASTLSPEYQSIIGTFSGDWLSAAKIYREWGTQQQWCQESRLKSGKMAKWLPETALWVWNRGYSSNVLPEAADLKKRLGLPVSVFWHWWHNCPYDIGFPEYLPPREGAESFITAVDKAQAEGIHSIVYMNSFQWGNSTQSWKDEGAARFSAKTINGGDYSHAFNIFTGKQLTPMCMATQFWRDKYSSLCDSVVNHYHTNGVYMDQACMSYKCYDTSHGHDIGGGNYWTKGFHSLTRQIRDKIDGPQQPILAGEGSGEDWISSLDLFLTLEASRERYMGVSSVETIPLYQAVYHDYAITFGNYSSLVYPPYDDLWPEEFNPANKETPLPEIYNRQFLMEQARTFVWGMQPTIANYHSTLSSERSAEVDFLVRLARTRYNALKYLLYGVYEHSPAIDSPVIDVDISRVSIYAGREGKSVTHLNTSSPALHYGTWRAEDGCLAVAIANIDDKAHRVAFSLNAKDYDLPSRGDVYLITDSGRQLLQHYQESVADIDITLNATDLCLIEFTPHN